MTSIRGLFSSLPSSAAVLIVAVVTTTSVFAALRWQAYKATTEIGLWFDDSLSAPAAVAAKLGGPLTADEIASITRLAQEDLERAFADFRIKVTGRRDAFWRVGVVNELRSRGRALPNSGEAFGLGPLGGSGGVGFALIAIKAVQYAPPGASRQIMIEGIGHGLGRVAAHEFAHQILGVGVAHDSTDENSYEYPSPDRASQYYGDLHWSAAGPLLQQKIGK